MSSSHGSGRSGNKIIRNIAASMIARKHDLKMTYDFIDNALSMHDFTVTLGIPLYSGKLVHDHTADLRTNNYLEILERESIDFNICTVKTEYFQSKAISDVIHAYLNSESTTNRVIESNPYKHRYNHNNDCFIHIRLGDVEKFNPGFEYYDSILSQLTIDNIFIATDSPQHNIIRKLMETYGEKVVLMESIVHMLSFGVTSKYVILSYGSLSAFMGYISYHSTVYFKRLSKETCWDWGKKCEMFSKEYKTKVGNWTEID